MSGGHYGRGKAPERQCLKVEDWPAEDRSTWLAACSPGSLLDDDFGVRSAHARISNAKDAKGYGRWLTHLAFHDTPALELTPGERITGQRVTRYVQRLEEMGLSSQTILDRLQELGAVAKVMRPDGDWRLINRIAAKIRARHKPARDKTCRVLSSSSRTPTPHPLAVAVRRSQPDRQTPKAQALKIPPSMRAPCAPVTFGRLPGKPSTV